MGYIYYKLWQLLSRIPTNDQPATNSMILLSMIQMANLTTVIIIVSHLYNDSLYKLTLETQLLFLAIVPYFISILCNYQWLYKRRDLLDEKYRNESKRKVKIGYVYLFIYFVGSFALFVFFGLKYK